MNFRHNDPQTPHERARALASDRLDGPLAAADALWLEDHLADCDACRTVATDFTANRELLRALPVPEPPRDLWARTSVALDRERSEQPHAAAGRPQPADPARGAHRDRCRAARRYRRRPEPPAVRRRGRRARLARAAADRRRDPARRRPGRCRLGRSWSRRPVHRQPGRGGLGLPGGRGPIARLRPARRGSPDHRLAQLATGVDHPRPAGRAGRRGGVERLHDRRLDPRRPDRPVPHADPERNAGCHEAGI